MGRPPNGQFIRTASARVNAAGKASAPGRDRAGRDGQAGHRHEDRLDGHEHQRPGQGEGPGEHEARHVAAEPGQPTRPQPGARPADHRVATRGGRPRGRPGSRSPTVGGRGRARPRRPAAGRATRPGGSTVSSRRRVIRHPRRAPAEARSVVGRRGGRSDAAWRPGEVLAVRRSRRPRRPPRPAPERRPCAPRGPAVPTARDAGGDADAPVGGARPPPSRRDRPPPSRWRRPGRGGRPGTGGTPGPNGSPSLGRASRARRGWRSARRRTAAASSSSSRSRWRSSPHRPTETRISSSPGRARCGHFRAEIGAAGDQRATAGQRSRPGHEEAGATERATDRALRESQGDHGHRRVLDRRRASTPPPGVSGRSSRAASGAPDREDDAVRLHRGRPVPSPPRCHRARPASAARPFDELPVRRARASVPVRTVTPRRPSASTETHRRDWPCSPASDQKAGADPSVDDGSDEVERSGDATRGGA